MPKVVAEYGREVADLLRVPFESGEPERTLVVKRGPQGPELEYRDLSSRRNLAILVVATSFIVFITIILLRG